MTLRIKNWRTFQHYKDRKPPWIKLHKELLDNHDYATLEPEAAKQLPLLWLIASESSDGELPNMDTLAYRLRLTKKACDHVVSRLSAWLEDDASKVLAKVEQSATSSISVSPSLSASEGDVRGGGFKPPEPAAVSAYASEIGYQLDGAAWCDAYAQKGWMVGRSKMKDWKAAVRNWKRNGWKPTFGNGSPPNRNVSPAAGLPVIR